MKGFSLSVVFASLLLVKANAQVNSQDSLALSNIYNTTNGNAWTQKWIRTQPVNTWFGVTISAGRVTGLNLQGNNLAGSLNSANIAKLTKLKVLNLDHNSLSGSIPAGIGSLTDLEQINLSFNAFTGTTPSGLFNNLQKLTQVNFANNNISGWFPSSVSNATALTEINFANNAMTNKIPTTINNLTLLTKFLVNNNELIGPFPTGKLCSPTVQVDVSGNQFTFTGLECLGANPNAIYNNQQELPLTQSNLKLSIAAGGTLANNTYTWYLNDPVYGTSIYQVNSGSTNSLSIIETGTYSVVVTNNQLPGLELKSNAISISNVATLRQQDSLVLVDIYNATKGAQWSNKTNWLTSAPLQDWYGIEITNGRVGNIFLNENNLEGTLPGTIKNLTGLKNIEMVKNKLSGLLPDLSKAPQLFTIRLAQNNYRGNLPAGWGNLVHLTGLELSDNQLTGQIPESYGNLEKLGTLLLNNNQLSGTIPARLALIGIFDARFDHNLFTGPVPQGFCTTPYLSASLGYNKLNFSGLECLSGRTSYANQAIIPIINQNPILKVAAGGTLGNNTYKWYKNEILVETKTGDSTFSPTASGAYHAAITNSMATELTLFTDTVIITNFETLKTDSLALVDFYNSTNGPNWRNYKWDLTQPVNTWFGITVSPELNRVTKFVIDYNLFLKGQIPASIGNLTELQEFRIRGWGNGETQLTGELPATIANLKKLSVLSLTDHILTGQIPTAILQMLSLKVLELRNNKFFGYLPNFLGSMKQLEIIDLSYNNLEGNIPSVYSELLNLRHLFLGKNKLTGSIPYDFKNLKNLEVIEAMYNRLSGQISEEFASLPKLRYIYLNNNQFNGPVPPAICSKKNTAFSIGISDNRFTFSGMECLTGNNLRVNYAPQALIPIQNENPVLKIAAGGTLSNNTYTWYNGNQVVVTKTGDSTFVPQGPGAYHATVTNSKATLLTLFTDTVSISNTGSLVTDSLALVDIYNNVTSGFNWELTNPVSTWEGVTIQNGRVTELYGFDVTGSLSASVGNLSALKSLWVEGFSLTGEVPASICNLSKIEGIYLTGNFSGAIPDDLGKNQQSLNSLIMSGNLTGHIPSGLQYATKLSELYLGENQLTGTIPGFFKNLPLFYLGLSKNKLTGSIPDTLSNQEGMSEISLSNNSLTGSIPKWFANYRTVFLDLSNNKLSGSLPDSIERYASWVRLSNNRFSGLVPELIGGTGELDISNNLLEGLAPVNCSNDPFLSAVNFSNNKLNYTSLECITANPNMGDAIISPQQRIPIINENPVLKAAAGGNLANNTYRWLRNTGHFVTKVGDSTLTITTPGVYACIVTNSAVPGVELRTHNANISTVSSRKMQLASPDDLAGAISGKLSVYPNPTGNDFIYIKGLQKAESILLYNASGQLVKQWQNVNGGQQLNIGSITNGVYMVKVVEKDKQTMLKFIKQ